MSEIPRLACAQGFLKKDFALSQASLPSKATPARNDTSPPITNAVVIAAAVPMGTSMNGNAAMAAQATNDRMMSV